MWFNANYRKKIYRCNIKSIGKEIPKLVAHYDFSEKGGDFEYLTKSSAVYSSNIEGNSIDLNSFMELLTSGLTSMN